MLDAARRGYYQLCLAFGHILRASRYSAVTPVDAARRVRKHRRRYAPFLVMLGSPLSRILDTGVRVLPQREWENREREMYRRLHRASIEVERASIVLPHLSGRTLAVLLEDPSVTQPERTLAIELAVASLREMHQMELTHGDAMAENVMIDLGARLARWFDFETVHDPRRSAAWRRADDVRALLATCLLRTTPAERSRVAGTIVESYADVTVARLTAASFASIWRRPLTLHLGQAPLAYADFVEIGRFLRSLI